MNGAQPTEGEDTVSTTTYAAPPQGTGAATLRRDFGLPGWITLTWTAGGGFFLGGFLVAALTLAGRMSGSGLLMTGVGLFVLGGVLGYVHGAALGYFGRPDGMTPRAAVSAMVLAGLYALPTLVIGAVVSGWISMTVVSLHSGSVVALALTGVAWVIGGVAVVAAVTRGWTGLRNAYARWPERGTGTLLVVAAFAALLVTLLAERPVLWGVPLRIGVAGALFATVLASIWIAGPAVTFALRAARGVPPLQGAADERGFGRFLGSAVLGLVVGAALGAVALPFFDAPLRVAVPGGAAAVVGAVDAAAVAVGRAVLDELFLRLFVVSATAWLILRRTAVGSGVAAVGAVAASALVQLLVYLPWVMGVGFPSAVSGLGFLLLVVIVPALALGTLFWLRGLGAALVANATALLVVALMAG